MQRRFSFLCVNGFAPNEQSNSSTDVMKSRLGPDGVDPEAYGKTSCQDTTVSYNSYKFSIYFTKVWKIMLNINLG